MDQGASGLDAHVQTFPVIFFANLDILLSDMYYKRLNLLFNI